MSQASNPELSLDRVSSWSIEECRTRFKETVPEMLAWFEGEENLAKATDVLKSLCTLFLPHIPVNDFGSTFHDKIDKKTKSIFDSTLESITQVVQNVQVSHQEVESCLQILITILDCIEICINVVLSHDEVPVNIIHTLPATTLHVLQGSYRHCKDSAAIYGELIGMLTEPLSCMFKKTHSLQMVLFSLIDRIQLGTDATDQDLEDYCSVLVGIHELCVVVDSLDVKITIAIWKTVSRLACQYKDLLKERLDVAAIIVSLCASIEVAFQYLFQLAPPVVEEDLITSSQEQQHKTFSRSVKIVAFKVKVLATLVKEFVNYLGSCIKEIYSLLLIFIRMMPPSLQAPQIQKKYSSEIERTITIATEPVLSHLLGNHEFMQCMTGINEDSSEESVFDKCLLQVKVLDNLPKQSTEVQDLWLAPVIYPEHPPRESIVDAIFRSIQKCHVELSLSLYLQGPMCNGRVARDLSFYEYVCTHLCGFVGSFPARHYGKLELCLLENVLRKNTWTALLAIDVWAFMDRYGTAELCKDHVMFLCGLVCSQPVNRSPEYVHLVCLLRRLVKLLAIEHQGALIDSYPPTSHHTLWSLLPITALTCDNLKMVTESLFKSCVQHLNQWNSTSGRTLEMTYNLLPSLACLSNLYCSPKIVQEFVTPDTQIALVTEVTSAWDGLCVVELDRIPVLERILHELLHVSGFILSDLQNSDILKILNVIATLVKHGNASLLCSFANFLKSFGKKTLPPSFEQSQILQKLPQVFLSLLSHPNPLVHQKTLEAFEKFAEDTVHESVVPECLQQSEKVRQAVVWYLNKEPHPTSTPNIDFFNQQKIAIHNYCSKVTECKENQVIDSSCITEPAAKRHRADCDADETETRSRQLINNIKRDTDVLCEISCDRKLPKWMLNELKEIQKNIEHILS